MAETADFGALLQLTAREGQRDDRPRVLAIYANPLEGERGPAMFGVAAAPTAGAFVWVGGEFGGGNAVQDHFRHDFFRALQLELGDLLAEPAAIRPLAPFVRRTNPGVRAE